MSQWPSSLEHAYQTDDARQIYAPIDWGMTSPAPELNRVPLSHAALHTLETHLLAQAPQLRLVNFRLETCTLSDSVVSFFSPTASEAHFEQETRASFSDVADYVAGLTLSRTFPRSYIYKVPSNYQRPTLLFFRHSSEAQPVPQQHKRVIVHCSIDADTILDMHTIFKDRGHCEIPVHTQFTHDEALVAAAEPLLSVHQNVRSR